MAFRRAAAAALTTLVGAVAAGLGVLALTVGAAAPAHAAECSGSTGVTVVADFNSLGGGVQGACVTDKAGDSAFAAFDSAGFKLNVNTPGNGGYVCQLNGKPTGCTPPDGNNYWALWWSDGKSGSWSYSSLGVTSLTICDTKGEPAGCVPSGGYVAFSWDDVPGDARPSYEPKVRATTPPTQQPSQPGQEPAQPTQPPSQQPGQPTQPTQPAQPGGEESEQPTEAPSASASATPGGTPSPSAPKPSRSAAPTEAPTSTSAVPTPTAPSDDETVDQLADPVAPTAAETEAAAAEDGGLPGWLAPIVIVLLFAVAGVVLLLQRRRPTP